MKNFNRKIICIFSVVVVIVFIFGIIISHIKESKVKAEYEADVKALRKTPAAEYCQNNGGSLVIKSDEMNDIYGMCNFKDGSVCEIMEYFKGECLSFAEQQDEVKVSNCGDLGICESESEDLSTWVKNMNNIGDLDEEIMDVDDLDELDIDFLYDYYENEFSSTGAKNDELIIGNLDSRDASEDLLLSSCEGVQGNMIDDKCFLSNGVEISF